MSYVQFAARFENLSDAFDDTQAEIDSNFYPDTFFLGSGHTFIHTWWVADQL